MDRWMDGFGWMASCQILCKYKLQIKVVAKRMMIRHDFGSPAWQCHCSCPSTWRLGFKSADWYLGQWLKHGCKSSCFQHQRTRVWIQSHIKLLQTDCSKIPSNSYLIGTAFENVLTLDIYLYKTKIVSSLTTIFRWRSKNIKFVHFFNIKFH